MMIMDEQLRNPEEKVSFPPRTFLCDLDKLQVLDSNGFRHLRRIHFPGMVDEVRPHVVLNGDDLQNIQPVITAEELSDRFTPLAAT